MFGGTLSDDNHTHTRVKRLMYGMCPPKFHQIGTECYYISDSRVNWLEAHFECKDKNSKLAEPEKLADRHLRQYLSKNDVGKLEYLMSTGLLDAISLNKRTVTHSN